MHLNLNSASCLLPQFKLSNYAQLISEWHTSLSEVKLFDNRNKQRQCMDKHSCMVKDYRVKMKGCSLAPTQPQTELVIF